ncbi:MAG: hypothetical protein GXO88_11290 [Chlorobi bacterium]|jgi:hypothetical protein|nr:hypothetical protein [Chlorobiota bacterium]
MKKKFIESTKAERVIQILQQGEKLGNRYTKGFDIVLFLLDDFFTELWYHENTPSIVKAKIIENEVVLKLYPDLVELSRINMLITK